MPLTPLVKREVKAFIKNPAFIVSLILIMAIYGFIGNVSGRAVEESVKEVSQTNIGFVVYEETPLTSKLIDLLNTSFNGRIRVYESIDKALCENNVVFIISKGFTENSTTPEKPIYLNSIIVYNSLSSIGSQTRLSIVNSVRDSIEKSLPIAISSTYNVTIEPSKKIYVGTKLYVFGREMDETTFMFLSNILPLLSLLIGLILGINASYASQIVAVEKVEKAFEMLLAQPVKRREIVLAKIIGSSIASVIFGIVYLISLLVMLVGMASGATNIGAKASQPVGSVSGIGNVLNTDLIVVIVLAIVIGLITSGALGVIVGSIVSDERLAGALSTPIIFMFMGVGFVALFIGLSPEPSTLILAGLSIITLPYIYIVSVLINNIMVFIYSLVASLAVCMISIFIAIELFERDIVVLGLRISRRKQVD